MSEISLSFSPSLPGGISLTINQALSQFTLTAASQTNPIDYVGTGTVTRQGQTATFPVRAHIPALPSLTLSPNIAVSVKVASPVEIRTVGGQATGPISVTHSPVLPAWLTVTVEQDTGRITWAGTRGDAPRNYTGVATVARQGVSLPISVSSTLAPL